MKKVSVIIPAYRDAARLEHTLKRLRDIRTHYYSNLEIIVGVRASSDETERVARRLADHVVLSGNVSESRNAGARIASGEIFIFLDADAVPGWNTIPRIAEQVTPDIIGTCRAYPSRRGFRPWLALLGQNILRRLHLIRGISNLLFCHRSLLYERGVWYKETLTLGEHYDFIWRAREHGVRFIYLYKLDGYEVDVRRYDHVGYLRTFLFWVKWAFHTYLSEKDTAYLEKRYWDDALRSRGMEYRASATPRVRKMPKVQRSEANV